MAGSSNKYILMLSTGRKDIPLLAFALEFSLRFTLALGSKNTVVCRTDPVAVLRLKISIMPRRATSDLPLTLPASSTPAILSLSELWGWGSHFKLRYCAYQ